MKPRSPGQTAISISLPKILVDQVTQRASALGLSRSQYLLQLARAVLQQRGDLTLREAPDTPQTPPVPPHQTDTAYLLKRKRTKK